MTNNAREEPDTIESRQGLMSSLAKATAEARANPYIHNYSFPVILTISEARRKGQRKPLSRD